MRTRAQVRAAEIPWASGPLKVVAISGSLRSGNFTSRALEIALRGAEAEGAVTRLLDLAQLKLPFCDERSEEAYPRQVARLRREVRTAHGVLLGSPEYHGSMSGAMKNALDLLGFSELDGKLVGLVAVAGGSQSATGTLATMRTVCRHLHAWVAPRQVSISRIQDAFTPDGHLKDRGHEERLLEVGRDVARYARLHFGLGDSAGGSGRTTRGQGVSRETGAKRRDRPTGRRRPGGAKTR